MYNTGHYVQSMPNLYAILWKLLTFMKFCGDYYDIYGNKRIFIGNAVWEILNRTFLNRISKYNGGYQVSMVTEKRLSRMKRTFFIDNVKK